MSNEDRLQKLKEKYVKVLNAINKEDLEIEKMHVENDKLFIRGKAPSEDAKNRFWTAVKSVDANYTKDFSADITVLPKKEQAKSAPAPSDLAPGVTPVSGKAPEHQQQTYTVVKGDTLSAISKRFYGNASEYMRIFNANRDQLDDPDKIQIGQVLKIPAAAKDKSA
ncbi:MAG TPA: LysM peptidoglycan-binding domain-containing protein [Acidobacteriota bacterium]|nr:LysM peptidoglycan-binding domain-containing protein [Acidobacteriota bacterium]